jgi:hypothetical protein
MPVEDPVFIGDQVRHDEGTLDSQVIIIKENKIDVGYNL